MQRPLRKLKLFLSFILSQANFSISLHLLFIKYIAIVCSANLCTAENVCIIHIINEIYNESCQIYRKTLVA